MSYTPLDVKTVIFADNLLLKNSVNNPAYASVLQSQAKIQMKEKSDIEQNRTNDIVEISRESDKIKRKNLGEDNTNQQEENQMSKEKEKNEVIEGKNKKNFVESEGGSVIDIIV